MPDQTNSSHPKTVASSSGWDKSEDTEKITEPAYEPQAPFPNRLKPKKHTAQMKKILEIFKQVKWMSLSSMLSSRSHPMTNS